MIDTGFVNFPFNQPHLVEIPNGFTYCYIVAIDTQRPFNQQSFIKLNFEIKSINDDITPKKKTDTSRMTAEEIIEILTKTDYSKIENKFVSCVLLGSYDSIFQVKGDIINWNCTFGDLTQEGKKLYYSLKKLHYDKEVKILTLNKF
jgi:hypothetical protein